MGQGQGARCGAHCPRCVGGGEMEGLCIGCEGGNELDVERTFDDAGIVRVAMRIYRLVEGPGPLVSHQAPDHLQADLAQYVHLSLAMRRLRVSHARH